MRLHSDFFHVTRDRLCNAQITCVRRTLPHVRYAFCYACPPSNAMPKPSATQAKGTKTVAAP